MKPLIKVGLIGFGTVGTGTVKLLLEHAEEIRKKVGSKIELVAICDLDISTPRDVKVDPKLLTTDARKVLDNPEIDIVVELIGGVKPAGDFIRRALENGKHVVTANKELIAKEGRKLLAEANNRHLDLYFEGSVGGGIPIIAPLRTCLAANRITEVMGIVNGTTNYILTKMGREGKDFAEALAEAQKLAMPNPTRPMTSKAMMLNTKSLF